MGPAGAPAALSVSNVSKTFPGGRALHEVSFEVRPGTVHALLGGNGSGKSTLVKALAGVQRADPGGIIQVRDQEVSTDELTSAWARNHGLRFVHQNPAVFTEMTVAENLCMGTGIPHQRGRIKHREMRSSASDSLARLHIDVQPDTVIGDLRLADQTMVAIARALEHPKDAGEISVLVLDEPTAALPEEEVRELLAAIRRTAAAGVAIVYISHRLDEVLAVADEITVLRDGRVVECRSTAGLSEADLVSAIVGRPLDDVFPERPAASPTRSVIAELVDVHAGPLKGVSPQVRSGEILGIAGLLGSGRTELLHALFGQLVVDGGEVILDGQHRQFRRPRDAMRAGVAYIPEDRDKDAAFADMSVRHNITITNLAKYVGFGRIAQGRERTAATEAVKAFNIKTAGDTALMSSLSGGNRQRVILARWLSRNPRLLLLDEPTQGVDVGARADAYRLVRAAVTAGAGAVLVTSDFEELADMADRVLVLSGGRIAAEVGAGDLTRHRITELVLTAKKDQT